MPSVDPYDKVERGLQKLLERLLPSEYLRDVMTEVFDGTFSFWAISCSDLVVQQVVGLILEGAQPDDLVGLPVHEALKVFEDSERIGELFEQIKKCAETGISSERVDSFDDITIETKVLRVGENGHSMCILASKRVE